MAKIVFVLGLIISRNILSPCYNYYLTYLPYFLLKYCEIFLPSINGSNKKATFTYLTELAEARVNQVRSEWSGFGLIKDLAHNN